MSLKYKPSSEPHRSPSSCFARPTLETIPLYRGTTLIRTPPPEDPTVAICPGTSGDPWGEGGSHERGTPVGYSGVGPSVVRFRPASFRCRASLAHVPYPPKRLSHFHVSMGKLPKNLVYADKGFPGLNNEGFLGSLRCNKQKMYRSAELYKFQVDRAGQRCSVPCQSNRFKTNCGLKGRF